QSLISWRALSLCGSFLFGFVNLSQRFGIAAAANKTRQDQDGEHVGQHADELVRNIDLTAELELGLQRRGKAKQQRRAPGTQRGPFAKKHHGQSDKTT